ncbi:MAG: hypothetical protein ACPGVD_06310, partial [Flavobacteriales bacterium]
MKKNIIIVLSLMMFLINCQNENKTEFVDSKLLYINVINPNQRIINQSRCITSPFLGATVIPDYEYRWILKDFENNSLKVIDTSDINVNDWVEFWVAESIWSSEDKSYTEKEFFREYYEKWTKEGRLNFSVKNLKSFNNIDSALVKNENKLFNNIYCY